MDTTFKSAFNVHNNYHKTVKFLNFRPGIYYVDTAKYNKPPVNAYSFFSTTQENKSYFSRREIEGSDRACNLKGKIGWPSVQDYQNIITKNKAINNKVTADDINRVESIYRPRVGILKGKMVRKRSQHVQNVPRFPLPSLLLYHYKTEHIGVYFMVVNGPIFLFTK